MLEFLLCSLVTIFPDYLFRRYWQGKKWGQELNLFSVWYELRYGLTTCLLLTLALITVVFYYHPSATNVRSFFRTVTILPETGGRVSEVLVENGQSVKAGQLLFRLDSASQEAAVLAANTRILQTEASIPVAEANLAAATATVEMAKANLAQAEYDLAQERGLADKNSSAALEQRLVKASNLALVRQNELEAAKANQLAAQERLKEQIPAELEAAKATLEQAEAELAKTYVYAGVDGSVEQFTLQVGDYVNPILRPAGILIPEKFSSNKRFLASFGQISAPVIKVGSYVEMSCLSRPFAVIPMVVVDIQDVLPSGQIRQEDRLLDPQIGLMPGSLTVFLEPVYPGSVDEVLTGSTCLANAYSNHHDILHEGDVGSVERVYLHAVDTLGLVHAIILRIQVFMLPVFSLVLSGH